VIRSSDGNVPGVAPEPRPPRWNQDAGANCQNYGPGNPYTSHGNSYGWRRAYAWDGYYPRRFFRHRYCCY